MYRNIWSLYVGLGSSSMINFKLILTGFSFWGCVDFRFSTHTIMPSESNVSLHLNLCNLISFYSLIALSRTFSMLRRSGNVWCEVLFLNSGKVLNTLSLITIKCLSSHVAFIHNKQYQILVTWAGAPLWTACIPCNEQPGRHEFYGLSSCMSMECFLAACRRTAAMLSLHPSVRWAFRRSLSSPGHLRLEPPLKAVSCGTLASGGPC